jgi:hypothetical protein
MKLKTTICVTHNCWLDETIHEPMQRLRTLLNLEVLTIEPHTFKMLFVPYLFPSCSQAWACNTNIDDATTFWRPLYLTVGPRILSLLSRTFNVPSTQSSRTGEGVGKWPFKRAAHGRRLLLTDGQDRWEGDLPWQRGFKWLYYVQNFNGVLDPLRVGLVSEFRFKFLCSKPIVCTAYTIR